MANTLLSKRSNVAGKIPSTTDIALGELAVNTYDGKLFLKKNDGSDKIIDVGASDYHGVEFSGALSFNDSTHIFSIASGNNVYWYKGIRYYTASAIDCDLDTYITLTTNTLYFIAFDDFSGTLKASTTPWELKTHVPVSTVFWNGSTGAIVKKTHGHTRNLDWHIWAHSTVGTRYGGGLDKTSPTTTNDALLDITSGTIYDEDLATTISQQTIARVWYQVSSGVYTFVDTALPYAGTSGDPKYLDTDNYTLTSAGDSTFLNMWVYAVPDIARPIYIIPTQASTTYSTIALAREEVPPALSGSNMFPDMKLLYKFTYSGDGQFQEHVDYRNASVSPAGGIASSTAASVSFIPTGAIAATTVQTALEELDNEKQPLDADLTAIAALTPTDSNFIVGNGTTWVAESDATVRTSLGLGTVATMTGPAGAIVGTTDTQTLTSKTLTDPVITGAIKEDVYTITDGAAFEIDPGNGSIQLITLTASRTPKATNFAAGESVTLMVLDGTAYAITWTDSTFGTSGVTWVGGSAPTLDTTKYTVIELWKVGSQVYGALVGAA